MTAAAVPTADPQPTSRMAVFLLWLVLFYSGWATIIVVGGYWVHVVEHWPIAAAMALGSYVAGSTPMGGGTVGFPVLTLMMDYPATLGRDFAFAVQSIGMTSASVYIIATRQKLAWRMLRWAMLGAGLSTPLGIIYFAPLIPGIYISIVFAVIWCSFGIMTLVKLRTLAALHGMHHHPHSFDAAAGLLIGGIGGFFVASVTGVGIDMLIYTVLVLACRADLRIAIPTSVILMAFTSLVGIATRNVTGDPGLELFHNWLAAAPVVALGAPLGAMVVSRIGRTPTLAVVAVLCIFQFAWSYYERWGETGWPGLAFGLIGLLAFNAGFHLLWQLSPRLTGKPQV